MCVLLQLAWEVPQVVVHLQQYQHKMLLLA
jgi:hypothetical protein